MAIHASAKKAARQSIKKRERNRSIRSSNRTSIRLVREAISEKSPNKEKVFGLLKKAETSLSKSASKGVLKKKTASRIVSRLSQAVNRAFA